jgi:hypothetical protein
MSAPLRPSLPLAALAVALLTAAPARADYTYGCTLPMVPRDAGLEGRAFDPRELVDLLGRRGEIQIQGGGREKLTVRPQYALWKPDGREPLAAERGHDVTVATGRHTLAAASDDLLPMVARSLEAAHQGSSADPMAKVGDRRYPGRFIVVATQTLDHDGSMDARSSALRSRAPRLTWPRQPGVLALTLDWVDARPEPEAEVRSHTLVLFLRAIGETEKN